MKHNSITLLALFLTFTSKTMASLELASLFTDNMVLQRGMDVPVWGWTEPNTEVHVQFDSQSKKVTSDEKGQWQITLDPLLANKTPQTFSVQSTGSDQITLHNVVVGEVWICSGQSNMQMTVAKSPAVSALAPEASNIRSFTVQNTVSFQEERQCEGQWKQEIPDSAVGFAFSYFLEQAANIPIGIIMTSWGSSSLEAWMPREMTETVPHFKAIMESFDADPETQARIKETLKSSPSWNKKADVFLRRQPNILYNAMMHPLAPYACRGIVWYQGERNTQSMHGLVKKPWHANNSGMLKYADSLKQWMLQYRKMWKKDDLHFLIVMLPSYGAMLDSHPEKSPENPSAHSWAWMRDSQLKALDLPHTSVANTIDLGALKDVHPKDKLPIGQRLALLAARDTLGQKVEAQGPIFNQLEQQEGSLKVKFDHAEGLQTIDGDAPTGFWVSDDSQNWAPADAVITGSSITLSSPKVVNPLYVRYAFAGKPSVNLVNSANLPAYPFRTDVFKP
ncbi:MAG: sialate O-acetylesterase [Akkermansiaceae bacterium]